jgi:methylisocitrate lyase
MTERSTTRLRAALARGPVIAPSVYDCLTARLAELTGFEVLHLAGSGVEASLLGIPDLGLLSLTEVADHAARVCGSVALPVIADIDTGFGGVLNVQRTIREMERAGLAGVHIEDQANPKSNPFLAGRRVVGRAEAVDRVKAAVDARRDADFLIIARTDADAISDEEVIERCHLFLEAGADVAFPIFLNCGGRSYYSLSTEEQEGVIRALPGKIDGPIMYMGAPPPGDMTLFDIAEAGWSIVLQATACFSAASNAVAGALREIRDKGHFRGYAEANPGPYHDGLTFMKMLRLDDYTAIEKKFTS